MSNEKEIVDKAMEVLKQLAALSSRRDVLASKGQALVEEVQAMDAEREALVESVKSMTEQDKSGTRRLKTESGTASTAEDAKEIGRKEARAALKDSKESGYLLIVDHADGGTLFMLGGGTDEVRSMLQCLEASQPSDSELSASDFESVLDGDVDKRTVTSNGATIEVERL